MKRLKFYDPLPKLVLAEIKNTTWRVGDEKGLDIGDELSLCYGSEPNRGNEFAKARIFRIRETTFGNLTEEDKDGHERFNSEEEMYQTYSRYYQTNVTSQTRVKVIKFKLV